MSVIALISPLPNLGRDTLKRAGYKYIQTRPPVINNPECDLSLEEYILEIARRYTNPPSKQITSMSEDITPSSTIRVILGVHTGVVYHIGNRSWVDTLCKTPAERRAILLEGRGRPWRYITGYVLVDLIGGKTASHTEETTIQLANISNSEVENYIHLEEPNKAIGGLYLLGEGCKYITCTQGSYLNAIGCCPNVIRNLLREVNINEHLCDPR